jgi:pimeloyl-ACP methyl ester carboxylesterase
MGDGIESADSPFVAYLHGVPGTPAELTLFDGKSPLGPDVFAPDRTAIDPKLDADAVFDLLAAQIVDKGGHRPIRLIGFSLGAFVALQIASRLGPRIVRLDLISAAASHELGDFLPDMAGRHVFAIAGTGGWKFDMLVGLQAALARTAPQIMRAMLFASASPTDRALLAQREARARYHQMLRASFAGGSSCYHREIGAYVQPWADCLTAVRAETVLWHGSEDDWTPFAMAQALAAALPQQSRIERLAGLSHYSTLVAALTALATELN